MVDLLTKTGDYRILERLIPRTIAKMPRAGFPLKGMTLDTETTGLDHRKNEIIEIGAIAFSFNDAGATGDVIGIYTGLQQPSAPIPLEITALTGGTNEMVAGQVIDMSALRALVGPADVIIPTPPPRVVCGNSSIPPPSRWSMLFKACRTSSRGWLFRFREAPIQRSRSNRGFSLTALR